MNSFLTYISLKICLIVVLILGGCSAHTIQGQVNEIIYKDKDGNTSNIFANVFYPSDVSAPYPVVIDMHGCSGIIPSRQSAWVTRLNKWGYAVIKPDSFNPRGDDNICDDLLKISPIQRLSDLAGTIDYVISNEELDESNIFAMGMSHGGTTVLLANYQPKPNFNYIKGVVAYYPYCIESLPKLITDTLILIGEDDDWTPASYCQRMKIVNKDSHHLELIVYPDTVHSFDVPNTNTVYLGHRLIYNHEVSKDSFQKVHHFLKQRTQ